MKKIIPIIAIIPMIFLALTPPTSIVLDCSVNSTLWLWATFFSGFLAFLFLYQKVSVWLKLLVVWCFVSSFLSRAPFISFTAYWSIIVCAYYYALCRKIDDWSFVLKSLQALFLFLCLLVIMQGIGKDTLLNFKHATPAITSTIGNKMIASSFMCILAPFLIINPLNWIALFIISFITASSGAVMALSMGLGTLLWVGVKKLRWVIVAVILGALLVAALSGDIKTFFSKAGRGPVWAKTVELCVKRPLGYGIGTYHVLFPYMCGAEIRDQAPGQEWNTSHNDFLQVLYETGFPGLVLLLGWIVSIVRNVKNPLKLAGLAILVGTMLVHFPLRVCQCAFIMLMFVAFLERKSDEFKHKTADL